MSGACTTNLSGPVASVAILDDYPGPRIDEQVDAEETTRQVLIEELQAQKIEFSQACQTLNGAIIRLNKFYDSIFAGHSEEIARLSVEIARKILMHKVENGDYEITPGVA